ncbi:MAG TPA: hypothetical protein VGI70_08535 [Polyangiales bacterium]
MEPPVPPRALEPAALEPAALEPAVVVLPPAPLAAAPMPDAPVDPEAPVVPAAAAPVPPVAAPVQLAAAPNGDAMQPRPNEDASIPHWPFVWQHVVSVTPGKLGAIQSGAGAGGGAQAFVLST